MAKANKKDWVIFVFSTPSRPILLGDAENKSESQAWRYAKECARFYYDASQLLVRARYDPKIGKLVGIDRKALRGKKRIYYSICDASAYKRHGSGASPRVRAERRRRARRLFKTYERPRRIGKLEDLPLRLKRYVLVAPSGCWLWTGTINWKGYGTTKYKYKSWAAHRLVYRLLVGPIPRWGILMHKCDNRMCVNPRHLKVATPLHNAKDTVRKGRAIFDERVHDKPLLVRRDCALTLKQIKDIRLRFFSGQASVYKLAREYHLPKWMLEMIIDYRIRYEGSA